MDLDVFDAIKELHSFYDGKGGIKILKGALNFKHLEVSMEMVDSGLKLKVSHPLRLFSYKLYNILARLYLINSVNLTLDLISNGEKKEVSKRFGATEDIRLVMEDLMDIPHEEIIDIIVDTEYFKIVETQDSSDNVSILMKKGDTKVLFKSLLVYLFPFMTMPVEKSAKEEITFGVSGEELTIDASFKADDSPIGIKSKKTRLI
ncbi:hypothetical protein M1293_02055 [Candidatus Parvarchaeota archaeon]|nr:hypothetical protein [Candidatus Parvarchaeota archaeon]